MLNGSAARAKISAHGTPRRCARLKTSAYSRERDCAGDVVRMATLRGPVSTDESPGESLVRQADLVTDAMLYDADSAAADTLSGTLNDTG